MAMHTIMDNTSPAHQGFQYWASGDAARHGPERFLGFERKHTLEGLPQLLANPGLIEETLDAMGRALQGGGLDCSCYQ